MELKDQLLELLRTDPAFREEVRRIVLTEELLRLPEKVETLVRTVQELAAAQRRTEEQLSQLVAAQRQTQESLARLEKWQQGETGRREGERYERQVIRRAPALFRGGHGGTPEQPLVQQRLSELLLPLWQEGPLPPEKDPLLADLIWWKGEEVAVVEISLKVDRYDIERATQRAAVLRQAGVPARGIVIGSEWATEEALEEAQRHRVDWLIGAEMSDGFRQFREKDDKG